MLARIPRAVKSPRRLIYVTTADHAYTWAGWPPLLAEHGIRMSMESWERLFKRSRVPRATYVLTDFDRLSPSELEEAAHIHGRLMAQGAHVYNDPRQFRPRAHLLKTLHKAGINSFTCHLPASGEWPERFPVFLRTLAGHRGVLSDLLYDTAQCRQALDTAIGQGYLLSDLAFVEFAAEPTASDGTAIYRKFSAFRIGTNIIRANTVHESHWMAKAGTRGLATDEQYRQELDEMTNYPLKSLVKDVFDCSGMAFGRIDFGLANGRHEVYEINTNPYVGLSGEHPNACRRQSLGLLRQQLFLPLEEITPPLPSGWIHLRQWGTTMKRR